jgi:hypothetical protein
LPFNSWIWKKALYSVKYKELHGLDTEQKAKVAHTLMSSSNKQTIFQLSAGGWKVDSWVKNVHFMEHGRLDSILGSYSIPGIDFPPWARLKILAQKFSISVQSKKFLPGERQRDWRELDTQIGRPRTLDNRGFYAECKHNLILNIQDFVLYNSPEPTILLECSPDE